MIETKGKSGQGKKGVLRDCPQDFDFDFTQKGFHALASDFVSKINTLGAIP
ncbi:MAG: hypothetical protein HQL84_10485 [Magnetococcales bacterium]|nr:hypothetical protein [Magnetococcales bacterium]MBF0150458.1 hypothetical protein [Magnetococcales bacterium]MBF0174701.1 hypothetical protein [Magnetococcales bacterium]MBF0348150.1 hypothetical protein [Magnetococcales bacterium]MBF0629466.1 hypothetical protein [Magnetococcales bacterium]